MTKATGIKRQGRRAVPAIRVRGAGATKVRLTLGDLIAAACDALGTEAREVAKVLSSASMARATGRRIVFV